MANILRKVGQSFNIPVHIYEADTEEDMNSINLQSVPMGSKCHIINDDKYKKFIDEAIEMLTLSQIDEEAKKYNLRPGMGLSAVQVGILKRIFVMYMSIYYFSIYQCANTEN